MIRKVYAVYISPTGNTAQAVSKLADSLAARLGVGCETDDFTLPGSRNEVRSYDAGDLVVFGTPTYAGRVPNKFLPFVQELFRGNQTPVIPLVTFGNRSYDSSLQELKQTLEANGFQTIAAAAVCCEHSFAGTGKGRPDKGDFQMLSGLAEKIASDYQKEETWRQGDGIVPDDRVPDDNGAVKGESGIFKKTAEAAEKAGGKRTADKKEFQLWIDTPVQPYYTPLKEDGTPAKFLKAKPKTDRRKCSHCGRCAELCPMGSISFENTDEVPGICVKCQACIKGCPQKAKYFDHPDFLSHKRMLQMNYRRYAESEIFLI